MTLIFKRFTLDGYFRVTDSKMPEDISKEFKKKISLKEFEVTNTANSGGEYSNGWDVKEATKQLKIKVIYPFYDKRLHRFNRSFPKMKETWNLT